MNWSLIIESAAAIGAVASAIFSARAAGAANNAAKQALRISSVELMPRLVIRTISIRPEAGDRVVVHLDTENSGGSDAIDFRWDIVVQPVYAPDLNYPNNISECAWRPLGSDASRRIDFSPEGFEKTDPLTRGFGPTFWMSGYNFILIRGWLTAEWHDELNNKYQLRQLWSANWTGEVFPNALRRDFSRLKITSNDGLYIRGRDMNSEDCSIIAKDCFDHSFELLLK